MSSFPDVTSLRKRKAELERSVQLARQNVDGLREQLRTHAADPVARAALVAKLAAAQAALNTETQRLTASISALNQTRAMILERNLRPAFTPQRPIPALLFPVRIETAFVERSVGMFLLRVRLYPDIVAIETHERELTEGEVDYARQYAQDMSSPNTVKRQDAWRRLARRVGIHRAAWIERLRAQRGSCCRTDLHLDTCSVYTHHARSL